MAHLKKGRHFSLARGQHLPRRLRSLRGRVRPSARGGATVAELVAALNQEETGILFIPRDGS